MAIAFDASSNGTTNAVSQGTLTVSHTSTGSNRALVVLGVVDNVNVSGASITGCTYNTVAMTQIFDSGVIGSTIRYYGFLLPGNASGANSIVLTASTNAQLSLAAVSYTGVNQTGQPDASGGAAITGLGPFTESVTTVADNDWVIIAAGAELRTFAASTNVTQRQNNTTTSTNTATTFIGDSNAAVTPPASFSQTITVSGNSNFSAYFQIALSPVPAGPPAPSEIRYPLFLR